MRDAYKRIYDSYQPGPVMDFAHWPEFFSYHHANKDDGQVHSRDYGGKGWRAGFSSAAPPLVPGSERFTLELVGADGMASKGAKLMPSGAQVLGSLGQFNGIISTPEAPAVPSHRSSVPVPGK